MPVKAGPKPDREYLRVTAMGLKEDAALLAEYEPPPAPAAPVLSASEKAARLLDLGPAAYLCGAASVLGEMDVGAWKIVLDDFLKGLGLSASAGPVARLIAIPFNGS